MLPKIERERLLRVIYNEAHGGMTAEDEQEMRRIVGLEFPEKAQSNRLDLVFNLAHGMLAVPYFAKALGLDVDVEA